MILGSAVKKTNKLKTKTNPSRTCLKVARAKFDLLNILYNTRISWETQLRVVDETGVDETGVDETGVDETGVDKTGVDETGVDETGVDETEVDKSGINLAAACSS